MNATKNSPNKVDNHTIPDCGIIEGTCFETGAADVNGAAGTAHKILFYHLPATLPSNSKLSTSRKTAGSDHPGHPKREGGNLCPVHSKDPFWYVEPNSGDIAAISGHLIAPLEGATAGMADDTLDLYDGSLHSPKTKSVMDPGKASNACATLCNG